MDEENTKKTTIKYAFDAYLLYLIQDVTKLPSADILNFFYELTTQVVELGFEKKREYQGIDKKIDDFFPNTSIPFNIHAHGRREWCAADIGFPSQITRIREDALKEIAVGLMERALLAGGEVQVAPFEKPTIFAPKMYKKLMDSFAGRPPPEKKPRTRKKKEEVPNG